MATKPAATERFKTPCVTHGANPCYAYDPYTLITEVVATPSPSQDGTFIPQFDDDGNQTPIKTSTGIWSVTYNGENRPILWSLE